MSQLLEFGTSSVFFILIAAVELNFVRGAAQSICPAHEHAIIVLFANTCATLPIIFTFRPLAV
jgi:hypothetical protein